MVLTLTNKFNKDFPKMMEYQGKNYARVSDILKPFVNFSHIPEEVLQRKAALGTRIHHAIDQEIQGNLPIVRPTEIGYFQSFHKWASMVSPIFVESETRHYCHKKMITGCIDALVKLKGEDKAILVDFKTSVQESPITWPMQAHLYYYLLRSAGKEVSDRFLFIKLDKAGKEPKIFEYKFDTTIQIKCFQAIDDFWEKQICCD